MNEEIRLAVFQAQVDNVHALEIAWRQLNRGLNAALIKSDSASVSTHTKLLLQVYCGLAEAVFSRTIHTPYGYELDEILEIKDCTRRQSITEGWRMAVQFGLEKTEVKSKDYRQKATLRINQLIDLYILDPSVYRNKIAHGQWAVALNNEGNAINKKTTSELEALDVISIYKYRKAFLSLAKIVEDLVESPTKAHMRDYWIHVVNLEETQKELAGWTLEKKLADLKAKKARHISSQNRSKSNKAMKL